MSMSSGGRKAVVDLAGWAAVCVVGAIAILNYGAIKSAALRFAGIELPRDSGNAGAVSAPQATSRAGGGATAELKAGSNGHFVTDADVNGRSITVMVDTGASMVALTYEDARVIGLAPRASDFTNRVNTANGVAKVALIVIDRIQIGDVLVRNVAAAVVEDGKLQTTLLGNSFLSKLSRYEMRSGRLVLEE
jgi:aspartyl protease family protein